MLKQIYLFLYCFSLFLGALPLCLAALPASLIALAKFVSIIDLKLKDEQLFKPFAHHHLPSIIDIWCTLVLANSVSVAVNLTSISEAFISVAKILMRFLQQCRQLCK